MVIVVVPLGQETLGPGNQILPDGGHISRNPGVIIEVLLDLLPLSQAFTARNVAPPPALINAIDRMMPMLRFFRHGDGSFAMFNGMSSAPSHLLATLLAGCSVALLVRGWRARHAGPWVARAPWTRSPPPLVHVGLTIGGLVLCAWFFEVLGFIVCGALLLTALFASLGARLAATLPLALGITLVVHTIFYSLLRVPLPWGLLERVAW